MRHEEERVTLRSLAIFRWGQVLVLVSALALLREAVNPDWPHWDPPWWFDAVALLFGLRLLRVRVTAENRGIRVVNALRTVEAKWSEIEAIDTRHSWGSTQLAVHLQDGRVIKSDGVAAMSRHTEGWVAEQAAMLSTRREQHQAHRARRRARRKDGDDVS